MTTDDPQALRWENDVPVSARFDDPYYSRADGLAETRHVFLAESGLPERWAGRSVFHIAELGFGTGLNLCALLHLWRRARPSKDARLVFTSFEKYPLDPADMARALAVWPEIAAEAEVLLKSYNPKGGIFALDDVTLELVIGDARQTLPRWEGCADAWFLDGFAPSRNPQLWETALLQNVATHSREGATVATYSAAGAVRRALQSVGFAMIKRSGYGGKREMLTGVRSCADNQNATNSNTT